MSQGVAFVFPGQGSQYIGMLELYFSKEKKFNYVFDKSKEVLGVDYKDLIFNGTSDDLSPTEITQPLMLTANNAIWECLEIKPEEVAVMAGHSLGEFSALVAAKTLTFEDALILVTSRAKFMQEAVPEGKGSMLAILGLEQNKILEEIKAASLDGVCEIANDNCPGQIVVSGEKNAIEKMSDNLKKKSIRSIILPVSAPFHCSLMKKAEEILKNFTHTEGSLKTNNPKKKQRKLKTIKKK